MSIVIDIAWDRPSVAQIRATGAVGVLRYFSTDSTKNLTRDEVTAYHAAGLGVGDVWETSTGRATQGYQAGVDDAAAAQAQRSADGLPTDQVIYFAVDEDTDWASVTDYFRGCDAVMGARADGTRLTGVYGGLAVIDGAAAAGFHYLWQTLAWSGGQRSQHAVLYQNGATALGGQADINDVLAPDWGQYPHPEADMTPDELLNAKMPTYAAIKVAGKPDYIPTVGEVLNGAKTADSQLTAVAAQSKANGAALSALKLELDAVQKALAAVATPQLTDAQVQALAAQVVPVLVPQLVAALGHALDGTKP